MWLLSKKLNRRENGLTLLEAVIALAVLGIVAIVILSALVTGAKATNTAWEQATAESLARSEIEYVKNKVTYDPAALTYPIDSSIIPESPGWSISDATVESVPSRDTTIQKITVTVLRYERTILSLSDYKANR